MNALPSEKKIKGEKNPQRIMVLNIIKETKLRDHKFRNFKN